MLELVEQIQPRMLLIATSSVVVLTLLSAYLYLFKDPLKEYSQLRQIRTQAILDVKSEQLGVDNQQMNRLEDDIEKLKERLYGKGSRLSPSQMVPYVIGELDRLTGPYRVQLVSVKPGSVSKVLMFDEVPFDIEVAGGYFDLCGWLQQVEAELRPMVVKQFQVSPTSAEKRLKMNLRVVSYRPSEDQT